jgi:hypothetical protein
MTFRRFKKWALIYILIGVLLNCASELTDAFGWSVPTTLGLIGSGPVDALARRFIVLAATVGLYAALGGGVLVLWRRFGPRRR